MENPKFRHWCRNGYLWRVEKQLGAGWRGICVDERAEGLSFASDKSADRLLTVNCQSPDEAREEIDRMTAAGMGPIPGCGIKMTSNLHEYTEGASMRRSQANTGGY